MFCALAAASVVVFHPRNELARPSPMINAALKRIQWWSEFLIAFQKLRYMLGIVNNSSYIPAFENGFKINC